MWYDESVVYQIYPLGAFGAPFENDGNQQHRIRRFLEWIEPLEKEGFRAVLFNPLFESKSHGYDTTDYKQIDCRLGDNEDFKEIVAGMHEHGLKVIVDTVFNHVGRDFAPFRDVLKNRENSPYKDWFFIDFNGNNSFNDGLSYQNWEGNEPLVKLNLRNPEVQDYLMGVIDFWKEEFDIDGLRMDVAYCLDLDFLRLLHAHVKEKYPDMFLLGEAVHGDYNTWCNDSMLDSMTNYECQKGIYSSFNSKNFYEILYSFNRQFGKEQWCLYTGKNLLSFLDNHDVNRIASTLENKDQLPAAYAMLMTMPGIPCIYYGSEWGIEGVKNANDTAIRPEVEVLEQNGLTDIITRLIEIRNHSKALQYGDYTQIAINNPWCIFQRSKDGEVIWTAINIDDKPADIYVNYQGTATDLMKDEEVSIDHHVYLEPNTFQILKLS